MAAKISSSKTKKKVQLKGILNIGTYDVAKIKQSDGLRKGKKYSGATIYYPTNATPPFASFIIVPGYLARQSSLKVWGPFLASHGIVTMTIGTRTIFEKPRDRRNAILDALQSLKQENFRKESSLLGNLDIDSIAVGGWSMGGGGAQLAALKDTNLKAVVALCPWLEIKTIKPSSVNHAVPVLFICGEKDNVARTSSNANLHYTYTPKTTTKLLYEVKSSGHFVANSPNGGKGYIGKTVLYWLKEHLLGDKSSHSLLLETPPSASKYYSNIPDF